MNDIDEVKVKISAIEAEISATKDQLTSAISAGKDNLIGIYGNDLAAQRNDLAAQRNNLTAFTNKENILLAGSGDLLSYWRSISMS